MIRKPMTARLSLLVSILICYFTAHFIYGAKSKHHRLVTLTPAEYNEWYTKDERDCINELPNRNGSCIITENCRSPIHNRIFWKKGIQGFTYPREHTIINLWTQLWGHKRNITIIFIGDFSTKQRIHFMNLDTARFMGADFIHRVDVKEEAADEKGNHFRAYFFSKELNSTVVIRHVHLTKDESISGQSGYHHLAAKILDRVNYIERSNALVLIHMGEAYIHQKIFAHELRVTMNWLNTVVQRQEVRNKIVWLTSWPQHYPNSAQGNGYYHGSEGHNLAINKNNKENKSNKDNHGYTCAPRTNITNDWRNNMLLNMLADPVYSHMDLFDDRDLIGPLYDMHKGGGDCTHLCYSPVMHQLLWDAMSKYVEQYESLDP